VSDLPVFTIALFRTANLHDTDCRRKLLERKAAHRQGSKAKNKWQQCRELNGWPPGWREYAHEIGSIIVERPKCELYRLLRHSRFSSLSSQSYALASRVTQSTTIRCDATVDNVDGIVPNWSIPSWEIK
jgi:hypothetical protein